MKSWFTSDWHLGHKNILKLCNRPFDDIEAMDKTIIDNFKQVVAPEDTLYFLGDFSFKRDNHLKILLDHISCNILFIKGNHDHFDQKMFRSWRPHDKVSILSDYEEIHIDGQMIVLSHYPMVDWNGRYKGSWHLFGHTHGRYEPPQNEKTLEVGVDVIGYYPWNFEQLKEYMNNKSGLKQ